ncbi:SMP-30/gluconolactonase/LRE family protein [Aquamicrobium sp. LC103]|uniref:SMP-30/gluconolactonase/LRE family protein n=1 Tax=Aquamicrobium sp. LC103 TaxID=1120658 RepID=UPI00069A49D9|nr:SMP-30/gluconolactonase/LRE family protein [Aquamicrobium sp. LC103]TKT69787.1 SMP-30/gluconolactonase/LRE family protein [Aquamicrobium sp. LC103]
MTALYEMTDPAAALFFHHEASEVIFSDGRWNEGPAYFPAWRSLIWSDIPNDRLMRFDEITGTVSVFRSPSCNANGNTTDRRGRLVTCEHGSRRLTRTEHDGSIHVLAERHGEGRLNSPNDVIVKSDGSIWFSDPHYGINTDYFGNRAPSEQDGAYVYRLDPATGQLAAVITTMVQPNGLAFSPDERSLFVVDTARTMGPDHPCHIRRFDVSADGGLTDRGVVVEASAGLFDGIRLDDAGRIWAGAGDGVHCYSPDGRLLGKILTGSAVINLCFGGSKRNILYMCAPKTVLRVPVRVRGIDLFATTEGAA